MTTAVARIPAAPVRSVRRLTPAGDPTLVAWLDAGLRPGREGGLVREYQACLAPEADAAHFVLERAGAPVAHAAAARVTARLGSRSLPIGLVGLVYTDPARRGAGLGSACVTAAADWLAEEGAAVALLWSDREAFYRRLGFFAAGSELRMTFDAAVIARAQSPDGAALQVGAPTACDWPALEALYAQRAQRAERPEGVLAARAAAPGCRVVTARAADRPVAYAALGRGDDFRGFVHEWAGSQAGVLACLAALARETTPLGLLSGGSDEGVCRVLAQAGASAEVSPFARIRLLRPDAAWRALTAGDAVLSRSALAGSWDAPELVGNAGGQRLSARDAVRLCFGPGRVALAGAALAPEERRALARVLPAPLYVWGFDSI